jgi:acetyl/propionyl-CoA carboxylase alpha subunit
MIYRFQSVDHLYEISLDREGDAYQAVVDGQSYPVEVLDSQPGQLSLRFDGRPLTIYWAADGGQKWLSLDGCAYHLEKPAPRAARSAAEPGGGQAVRAPMPAQVRALQVAEGDRVEKGQTILLLEAMKMEIRIKAPAAGLVYRLLVAPGQAVEKEQLLAEIRSSNEN